MIDFQQLTTSDGVPIYFQRLPGQTVSLYWVVMVGSADDEIVGAAGIYHWFEHLPSRGTRKYPGGYRDTEARLIRYGGEAGAETGHTYTSFYVDVPRSAWQEALNVLADMIAQPLLRPDDIEAEREIIGQEIDEWHSSPFGESLCRLPAILWPNHPLGHDQLGTHDSIESMDGQLLREAHERGYSRSRCVLFVAGDLEPQQVVDAVEHALRDMSAAPLSERRRPATYGPLPKWRGGRQTIIETDHDDSVVYLLFPVPALADSPWQLLEWDLLEELLTAGGLGSPLLQVVREHGRLAYSPDFQSSLHPDGGYCGLVAQTSHSEPQRVLDAFWQLLKDPELRSRQRRDYLRDAISGRVAMHDFDADLYTETGCERLIRHGQPLPDEQFRRILLELNESCEILEQLTPDRAWAVIFQGSGAS